MRISELRISNYKSLRDVTIPMSSFVCVIGQNNAGKSSLLQALLLLIEGKKLNPSHFYDPSSDVVISAKLEEISDEDLELVAHAEHRERVRDVVVEGRLTLVRRYGTDGTSKLRWIKYFPKDERFSAGAIEALTKGKKSGPSFSGEVVQTFPELAHRVEKTTNATTVKELINQLAGTIPRSDRNPQEVDLATGIDASVKALLPEPIYIPAVKDFLGAEKGVRNRLWT